MTAYTASMVSIFLHYPSKIYRISGIFSQMYVKSFSECLKHESEKRGVIVQVCVCACACACVCVCVSSVSLVKPL